MGIFAGKNRDELQQSHPEEWKRFRLGSWDAVEGAESSESLYRRAVTVWERCLDDAQKGAKGILCVSHGGLIQWIIRAAMAGSGQTWMPLFPVSNCGIFHLFAAPALPGEGFYAQWKHLNLTVS